MTKFIVGFRFSNGGGTRIVVQATDSTEAELAFEKMLQFHDASEFQVGYVKTEREFLCQEE